MPPALRGTSRERAAPWHGVNEAKMNHKCPHCNAPAISKWQKLNSGPLFPAKCKNCNGLSEIQWKYSLLWVVVLTTVAGLFSSLFADSGILIPVICYLVITLAGLYLMAKHCPLVAIEGRHEN